tara:strand:- start:2539 stop:3612 length:1074 start_codon:yes stop_codon:yes gene_type:complete
MDNAPATKSMQDIATSIEDRMYPDQEPPAEEQAVGNEPKKETDEVVIEDAIDDELPIDDDTDSETDDGSDLENIASEEDLTLADYLGVDEEKLIVKDDGKVFYNAIIDGKPTEVPLSELATSYQMQGHVNNKSMALETERKEFQETRNKAAAELQTRLQGVETLSKVMEEQLVGEYNSIDWERLRFENPGEWTALRQDYAEKAQEIKRAQGLAKEEGQRLQNEQQQEAQGKFQNHLKEQFGKMIIDNPTWQDEAVMTKEVGAIGKFVQETYGYSPQDAATITDSRLMSMVQDAKRYREGLKGVEEKLNKPVPKFIKPGASKQVAASTAKARKVKAQRGKLRKTGSVQDTANLILDRM